MALSIEGSSLDSLGNGVEDKYQAANRKYAERNDGEGLDFT
jgi:hypothetical protein